MSDLELLAEEILAIIEDKRKAKEREADGVCD